MENKNKNKKSKEKKNSEYIKNIKMISRGYKMLFKLSPVNMFWRTVNCISQQLTPYLTLFMSALIINEILAGAGKNRLITLALITVGGQFLIAAAINFINWKAAQYESVMWQHEELCYMEHQNAMKYEFLEDSDITMLRMEIANAKQQSAMGFMQLYWGYWFLLSSAVNIILSVSLTASMIFKTPAVSPGGLLGAAASPASAIILLLLIIGDVIVSVYSSNVATLKTRTLWEGYHKRNMRLDGYFRCQGNDSAVFDMRRIILPNFKKADNPAFFNEIGNINLKYGTLQQVWAAVMYFMLLLFVGAKAYIGVFGIGSLILYRGTVERFIGACSTIGARVGRLFNNNKYMKDIFTFLDLPRADAKGGVPLAKTEPLDIEFRRVSFKYPKTDEYALKNISLRFKAGEKIAMVGMNGSGKTTLIKLICRLYEPTEGEILLGGRNINDYKYHDYMAYISVVFQDFTVFAFSIAENVAGAFSYDSQKVLDCLKKAGLGERVAELEDGIQTTVYRYYENKGIDLSGGEAQKLAIARALYKDSPLVILDEPTASLDPVAEAEIYSSFDNMVSGKTAIYISHRLSSCKFCDSIAVFHESSLVQFGSHKSLIEKPDGKYYELWNAQSKYYVSAGKTDLP